MNEHTFLKPSNLKKYSFLGTKKSPNLSGRKKNHPTSRDGKKTLHSSPTPWNCSPSIPWLDSLTSCLALLLQPCTAPLPKYSSVGSLCRVSPGVPAPVLQSWKDKGLWSLEVKHNWTTAVFTLVGKLPYYYRLYCMGELLFYYYLYCSSITALLLLSLL